MAFKGTPGMIADAFQNSFRQKRAEIQRQREIEQEMANRDRQEGLLQFWKQKNFEEQVRVNDATISNQKEDNVRQQKYTDAQIDNWKTDNERQAEQDRLTAEYRKAALNQGDAKNNIPLSPGDFSEGFSCLDYAWSNFEKYRNAKQNGDKWSVAGAKGKLTDIDSSNDLGILRRDAFDKVVVETNAMVKKINAQYPGFEKFFNRAFQKVGKDPKQIDPYVENIKDAKGNKLPEDARRWLKEILHKRIF